MAQQVRYVISDRVTGLAQSHKCEPGTSFETALLDQIGNKMDLNRMTIRVNRGGANFTPARTEQVQEGDRIKVVPEKVDLG